jgi:hypothetical protein
MVREVELHHLEKADTHIAKARKKLARQRALVARLQKSRAVGSSDQRQKAEAVLGVMENSVRALEGHRSYILEQLGLYQPGESGRRGTTRTARP